MRMRSGPSGVHFFDRESGTNILIDDCVQSQDNWSISPRQVSIALTNICNLSCAHCYAPKNNEILKLAFVKKLLSELDKQGCFGVGFGGGEPTLHPHLIEICKFAKEHTNLAITMTTHGHNFTDRLVSKLENNIHFIRVSMDGVGKTYEAIRQKPFQGLLNTISILKKISPVGINYVVNSSTVNELDRAIEIAESKNVNEFLLLPEESVNGSGGIDLESMKTLKNWVSSYKGKVRLSISETHSNIFPTCNPLSKEKGLNSFAHVDASGYLKQTSYHKPGVKITEKGLVHALKELGKETEVLV